MLDISTRRRIDTARDILVGKVPDPKSQVEQITVALIYKFMDDMDATSEEFDGERTFFAGEFAQYGWARLMRSGLGGQEIMNLYAEALVRMPENPGIPPLFRSIFNNAYLPYRDLETLRAFLKVIDEFTYDHSERLGDAYEYLLSVLGSQGDAGQFRTPRHIIDFIVEVVDPQKDEIILDPACGTAGFLISSYKHIQRANTNAQGHTTLTEAERERLSANLRGYDISPDMVRLSLVNMYLHGFVAPHIYEYDTLTSQDHWNEYADVILANPPFMSPKGGIRPHNRFSVQSKRSEVLFVDYMMEHLTLNGRAGIIVPEGIIFQSQKAYKTLRQMLVDDYLVAVVSLPSGVFQPYSGVKTSILILDKALARRANTIGFFKIEHDGFDLGAQRRPIDKNDLPQARAEITEYLRRLRLGEPVADMQPTLGLIVPKSKIVANGDYNLSGERYRESQPRSSQYPMVPLGEVCELIGGGTPSKRNASYWRNGSIKWISSKHINERGQITGYELITKKAVEESSTQIIPRNSTIIITRVSVGKFGFADDDYAVNQDLTALVSKDTERLAPDYIRVIAPYIAAAVERNAEGIGVRGVTRNFLSNIEFPLPPLSVQREIVAEIEGYQRVIDGARAVLDNYRPRIAIDPKWPMVKLENLVNINNGYVLTKFSEQQNVACIKVSDMNLEENQIEIVTSSHWLANTDKPLVPVESIIFPKRGAAIATNKKRITKIPCLIDNNCMALIVKPDAHLYPRYLFYFLVGFDLSAISNSAGIALINNSDISEVEIPLPPLATQRAIVAEIEAEQKLVEANRELIERIEKKVQAALARVWGE